MSRPGAPHPVFKSAPDLSPAVEEYFWAYMALKGRASSMSGVITWSDLNTYHSDIAPHLRKQLLLEYVSVLEQEDTKISESRRPK